MVAFSGKPSEWRRNSLLAGTIVEDARKDIPWKFFVGGIILGSAITNIMWLACQW